MEIHQLKTFMTVAREGSISRAAETLCLSQPAVSAHIKAIEDTFGLILFERTPRGMSLTREGEQLLRKTEQTLGAHQDLLTEAARLKGRLNGKLHIGNSSTASTEALGRLMIALSERCPEVELVVQHGNTAELLKGIRNGSLDAGFYNDSHLPDEDISSLEVGRFSIFLAAPPGLVDTSEPVDWQALAQLPWICPTVQSCCKQAADHLFEAHNIRPQRIISIDREAVTRTLIGGGVGVGLLHADSAREAQLRGEIEIICEAQKHVRVLFAHTRKRVHDPLLMMARSILQTEHG
ncbi:LysR family transcriptional regulator [Gynuella sunshinyii]|uniref:Transcriptional regulator n=1 Tax=Gynuella sunshinyii YC6258 TaxID=1445510 RepID=A0A0C5VT15_9GAMM|nr:LysR family transcriptional regulator [Gynuella sunshinyii]AJQ93464.1 transcriptional regulator [Gynuella sunshinyii YC6258]